jgi:large subunit ribosomal protein L25
MEVARMKAERRSALGRNQIKKLRTEGWMPAVVYGGEGKEPLSIQISEWELDQHVSKHHKVFSLELDGQSESVWLQDIEWKATTDRPLHADFLRIDLDKPWTCKVEVALLGHPAGLSKGGTLIKDNLVINVSALPKDLPDGIEIDISKLDAGDSLRAKDLPLPEGVSLGVDPELYIVRVTGGK